jgi:hypothetical protein
LDIITHFQLRSLIEAGKAPCVSIFMPTHREREMRQDPARLKNLIRIAEEKLIATGMRPTLARDLTAPAKALLEDADFWSKNRHGLAIYVCDGLFRSYRLPLEVEETALVNQHFEIKPLLPLLYEKLFYVLAIAQHDVRLLECTKTWCRELELPADIPKSILDAIKPGDGHESGTVRHSGDSSNPFSQAGAYHGQMTDTQKKEAEDRMFYYRQVDDGVRRVVKDPNAPLVLAGADSTVPFYRQANTHRNTCESSIPGNPEHVSNDVLRERAIEVLAPIWHRELNELQEQYGTAYAHQLASNNINQIVPAAAQGRVGILFLDPKVSHPGKFDAEHLFVDDRSDEEDLVDAAAVQTLMTGGQLVVVEKAQVPGNGEIAAIYRYMA